MTGQPPSGDWVDRLFQGTAALFIIAGISVAVWNSMRPDPKPAPVPLVTHHACAVDPDTRDVADCWDWTPGGKP